AAVPPRRRLDVEHRATAYPPGDRTQHLDRGEADDAQHERDRGVRVLRRHPRSVSLIGVRRVWRGHGPMITRRGAARSDARSGSAQVTRASYVVDDGSLAIARMMMTMSTAMPIASRMVPMIPRIHPVLA